MKIFKKTLSTLITMLLTFSLIQGQFVVKAASSTPSFSSGFVGLSNNPAIASAPQQFFLTAGNYDGEVQYQVFYIKASLNSSERNNPNNWTKVQDWTTSQSALVPYVYNVPALPAGDYSFAVRVKRAGFSSDMTLYKNAVGEYDDVYAFNYSFKSSSSLDVTGIKTSKNTYSLGDTISIDGLDSNTKYKLYTFSQSVNGTNWSKDPAASGSTLSWTPTASGNYVLDVQAFDSKNNIVGWKLLNVTVGGVSTTQPSNPTTPANTNTTPTNTAPSIVSVSNVVASTIAGTAPTLPTTITATLSDGTTKNVNVVWDSLDASKYSTAGTFSINGTIAESSSIKVIASITVTGNSTPVVTTPLAMSSAVVTGINTIKVTFNKTVSDYYNAKFTISSGYAAISLNTPVWNDAKTEATLTAPAYSFTSGGYVTGNYLVSVSNLANIDTTKNSITINGNSSSTITNNASGTSKVTSISFTSTQLSKSADGYSATFNYSVKDQYGADITSRCTNLQTSTSFGSAASIYLNPATSIGTIYYNFNASYTTTSIVVSMYDPSTGVSNSATLTVGGLTSTASTFVFGDVSYVTNNSSIPSSMSTAATIPFTVRDQYGSTITDLNSINNSYYLTSSNSSVAIFTFITNSSGSPAINVNTNTGNTSASQTVTLTVTSKTTGSTYTKMLSIGGSYTQIGNITFGDLSSSSISVGDTNIVLPITVTNFTGTQISPAEIVANASSINSMISSNGCISPPQVVTDITSMNYGKLTFNALYTGTATISAYTSYGSTVVKQVTINGTKQLTSINVPSSLTVNQGATAYITPVFLDQYGTNITSLSSANTSSLRYSLYLTKLSGADNCVTVTPATLATIPGNLSSIAIIGGSSAGVSVGTGSYRLTINITDTSGNIKFQTTVTITTV